MGRHANPSMNPETGLGVARPPANGLPLDFIKATTARLTSSANKPSNGVPGGTVENETAEGGSSERGGIQTRRGIRRRGDPNEERDQPRRGTGPKEGSVGSGQ